MLTKRDTQTLCQEIREKARKQQTPQPLKGADRLDTVYLYITSCPPDVNENDTEEHLSEKFQKILSVSAQKTAMTHDFYTTFSASARGRDIKLELFMDSCLFSRQCSSVFKHKQFTSAIRMFDQGVASDQIAKCHKNKYKRTICRRTY